MNKRGKRTQKNCRQSEIKTTWGSDPDLAGRAGAVWRAEWLRAESPPG